MNQAKPRSRERSSGRERTAKILHNPMVGFQPPKTSHIPRFTSTEDWTVRSSVVMVADYALSVNKSLSA